MTESEAKVTQSENVEDRQRCHEPERKAEAAPDFGTASATFEGLLGASAVDPPVDRHSSLLADPRLSHPANAVQRARIVSRIQESYGNAYVQRILGVTQNRPASIARSMLPTGSSGERLVLQRDLSEEETSALSEELQTLFGTRRRDYSRLDAILVERPAADVLQVYQRYEATYGEGSFVRGLDRFVSGIPAREGQSPEEAQEERDSYWDRYAARLYDAGVGAIQREFHANRPVPVNPANERRWLTHWRGVLEQSNESYAPLALWILARWNRIQGVEEIERRGWTPPRNTSDFRASFGVLSQHRQVREEGERAGEAYWATIHGRFLADLQQVAEMARSYHESYIAAHWAAQLAWNPWATNPPMREELEQGILDWHSINSRGSLPYREIAGWVSNWMTILRHWRAGDYISSQELEHAGMAQAASASP
ncbi:MAG: hypothetical protein R6U89_02655 [Dehalococcoidia bacterium]